MPEDIFKDDERKKNKSNLIATFALLLFLAVLCFITCFYSHVYRYFSIRRHSENAEQKIFNFKLSNTKTKDSINRGKPANAVNLNGYKFIFTGKDKGSKFIETLGVYDFDGKALKKVAKPYSSSILEFSEDKGRVVGIIVKKEDLDKYASIYKAADFYLDNNFKNDFSFKDAEKILVNKKLYHYKNLDFNLDINKLVFNALDKAYKHTKPYYAKEWGIYILDLNSGNVSKIANGLYPHWVDKNRIIFLENNGLKVLNFKTGNSYYLRKLPYKAEAYLYFDLNLKKGVAVWSFPKQSQLLIMKVSSTKPFALKDERLLKLKHAAVRPKISKNAKYAIFLTPEDYKKFKVDNHSTPVTISVMSLRAPYTIKNVDFDLSAFDVTRFKILDFFKF